MLLCETKPALAGKEQKEIHSLIWERGFFLYAPFTHYVFFFFAAMSSIIMLAATTTQAETTEMMIGVLPLSWEKGAFVAFTSVFVNQILANNPDRRTRFLPDVQIYVECVIPVACKISGSGVDPTYGKCRNIPSTYLRNVRAGERLFLKRTRGSGWWRRISARWRGKRRNPYEKRILHEMAGIYQMHIVQN
jgi:hypothetical protein